MSKQLAFHVDLSGCIGCKACQIACQDKHNLEAGRTWRRVAEVAGGRWVPSAGQWHSDTFAYYVSMACMHCEKPICCEVCPTRAMAKRPDGVVLVDQEKCIGCRYCQWACPYGAPQFDAARGKMTKCTFCEDLLAQKQSPACVAACVMRVVMLSWLGILASGPRERRGVRSHSAQNARADTNEPVRHDPPRRGQAGA